MEVNNTLGPIDIAISGLQAQGKNLEVISSNIANLRTTDAGNGQPYRRLEAILKTKGKEDEITGVTVDKIITDMSDFNRILDPGNPDADENGYVTMPNVNLPTEMINLNIATRVYQANAAILKRYQQMVEVSLELLR
jgi:flagellar basal-body rod protein FlgC